MEVSNLVPKSSRVVFERPVWPGNVQIHIIVQIDSVRARLLFIIFIALFGIAPDPDPVVEGDHSPVEDVAEGKHAVAAAAAAGPCAAGRGEHKVRLVGISE